MMIHRASSGLHDALEGLELRAAAAVNGDEFRRWHRFAVRGEAELYPMNSARLDRGPIEIHLRDIGVCGVGFLCNQRLELGTAWQVSFKQRGYSLASEYVVICHCSRVRDNIYLCGGQFCASGGLLNLLGVDRAEIEREFRSDTNDSGKVDEDDFVAPGEVG